MPHYIELTKRIKVSSEKVWDVLKDFDSIEKTSHTIEKSPLLEGAVSGVGCRKKCFFYDGKTVVEEIIEYNDGESFKLVLSEYTMPMKSIEAELKVKKVNDEVSDISMSMTFVVKGGLFGRVIGSLLLQHVLKRKVLKGELDGLAFYASTGRKVENKLPTQKELALIEV